MRRKSPTTLNDHGAERLNGDMSKVQGAGRWVLNGLTIAAFLVLNASLNMLNRWVLGVYGFKFPIFLTMAHLTIGFFVLSPIMTLPYYSKQHAPTLKAQWKGIACVGSFKVANIVANNASLVLISLSLNQIIRSGIPIVTAILGIAIEHTVPTGFEVLSLIILTLGVVLAIWEGSLAGSPSGIGIALASTFCGAAMLNFSGKVLREKMDVLRLTFYTAPVSVGILVPFFLMTEFRRLVKYGDAENIGIVVWYLLLGGVNAVLYNIVHYRVIQITSSTATPVIGMVKVVGIVVLSALFLGERDLFTVRMVVGCTLAVLGFSMYSYASLEGQQRRTKTVYVSGPPQRAVGVEDDRDLVRNPLLEQKSSQV
ncbi:hypothetical protein CVIRNUC_006308 [Coccomyxa viridis]|uniref:Sugar phosphate transporter domain-containing protein n=1 Tax=Coccomyxa viridis TaxID=1274662 RepID=A0AAV1I7H0_9CHLO|nr:hypothetical protein CVIRNUC_006308 [Coccomyxa viridis]